MRQRRVRIPLMTGWLSGFSAATAWFAQRRLPAGWLGLIMILTQILAFGSDLLVAGLVKTTQIHARCLFHSGVVLPTTPVSWRSIPDVQQQAYRIVSQAKLTSLANGG